MAPLIVFIFIEAYVSRWKIKNYTTRKRPSLDNQESVRITFGRTKNNLVLFYTFNTSGAIYPGDYLSKMEIDYNILSDKTFKRSSNNNRSIFEEFNRNFPQEFAQLPADALMLRTDNIPNTHSFTPYVEVSIKGDIDYTMYESKNGRLTLRDYTPKNVFRFDPIFSPRDPSALEVRFELEHATFVVVGCKAFWTVMGPELITPLLNIDRPLAKLADAIITTACVRYLTLENSIPLTTELAEQQCKEEEVPALPKKISCNVSIVYDENAPPQWVRDFPGNSTPRIPKRSL